jgi:hypothetical protein
MGGRKHRQSHKGTPENGAMPKKRRSGTPASRGNGIASTSTPAPLAANGTANHEVSAVAVDNPTLASGNLAPASAADSSSTTPMDIPSWASAVETTFNDDIEMATNDANSSAPPPSAALTGVGSSALAETPAGPGVGDVLAGGA